MNTPAKLTLASFGKRAAMDGAERDSERLADRTLDLAARYRDEIAGRQLIPMLFAIATRLIHRAARFPG